MINEKLVDACLYILYKLKDVSIVNKDVYKEITEGVMKEFDNNKEELKNLNERLRKLEDGAMGHVMTKIVTYTMLCKNCNEKSEYVMRSETINPSLSDNDVMFIINNKPDYEYSNCEHCNLITKKEYISFNINVKPRKVVKR